MAQQPHPGRVPATRITVPAARAIVDCGVYVDGGRLPGRFTHQEALAEVRARGAGFVWVGLYAPDEDQMNSVAQVFGLHPLVVEDAVHAHQRAKLERYDDLLFLVLRTVKYVEHASLEEVNEIVETGEVMVFVGADFVITVRHGDHSGLHDVRLRLEQRPAHLALGPTVVMHAIADHVVDSYLSVTEAVDDDIEELEREVFAPTTAPRVEEIYSLKRDIVELRRAIAPLGAPLTQLSKDTTLPLGKEVRRYFRDVADHHSVVAEQVASYDEVLSSLVHAAVAKIAMRQNGDMRRISAWVAIIAVPTMIAGVYGMNFDMMPELHWRFGYPLAVALMVTASSVLFMLFRRNRWL